MEGLLGWRDCWDGGIAGLEGAGTEEAQLGPRWPLEPKGGAGAKGEGGVCHGRQDKGFGAKGPMEAGWRQVGA